MNVANENTPQRTRRRSKRRRTSEFSVLSADHQEIIRSALRDQLHGNDALGIPPELIAWKRRRIASMLARLNATLKVHRSQQNARG